MTEDIDIYTYRTLPWLSKSALNGFDFCERLFKFRYIDKIDAPLSLEGHTGVNLHLLYAKFFKILNYPELAKIPIDYTKNIEDTTIYHYIYSTAMEMIPPDSRTYNPYRILVGNFSLIEAAHWIDLNRKYKEAYSTVLKFFIPREIESYAECKELMLYGTRDRVDNHEDEDKIRIIYDYKTHNVPIAVREQRGYDPGDSYSWKLPVKQNRELHFYIILDMAKRGFKIDPELIQYCTNERYFGTEPPNTKHYFYDKEGKPVDFRDLYRIGIIYTGDDNRPYVPKKKPHVGSMRSVFKWINKLRTVIFNGGPYNKKISYFKCKYCPEFLQNICLDEAERKFIFWEKSEESEESKED